MKSHLNTWDKIGPQLEKLLLTDADFRLEMKDDIKAGLKSNATLQDEIKDDANIKAEAQTKLLTELRTNGSEIREDAYTKLRADLLASDEAKN